MNWYDLFSRFYDGSVAALYRGHRELAREKLELESGMFVLDVGCGTGLSLDQLAPAVGGDGRVVGVDRSAGMLERAARRVEQQAWTNVDLLQLELGDLDRSSLVGSLAARDGFDRALCFLVLSALSDWNEAFGRVWELIRPGGRAVIVDVHAERPGFQGRMVNLTARADIRRPVWTALERRAAMFECQRLAAEKKIGGDVIVATGVKPATRAMADSASGEQGQP